MSVRDEPPDDPFEGLELDEAWAAGASIREPSARSRSLQADLTRLDAERAQEEQWSRRNRRRRVRRRRGFAILALVGFVGAIAIADRDNGSATTTWASGGDSGDSGDILAVGKHPPPAPATSSEPLGEPADPDAGGGRFQFLQTRSGTNEPVTYDPCRPVPIVVNEGELPDGLDDVVADAVATTSEITGLELTIEGTTDERPQLGRSAYQPDRYGERWAPVLVAWSDEGEVPELAGDIAGFGGSVAVAPASGPRTYVSGIVVLDAADLAAILREPEGERTVRDIVLHELGHLVGLAHVDDPSELMYPEGQASVHGYQEGDRTGLTRLGQGTCVARL